MRTRRSGSTRSKRVWLANTLRFFTQFNPKNEKRRKQAKSSTKPAAQSRTKLRILSDSSGDNETLELVPGKLRRSTVLETPTRASMAITNSLLKKSSKMNLKKQADEDWNAPSACLRISGDNDREALLDTTNQFQNDGSIDDYDGTKPRSVSDQTVTSGGSSATVQRKPSKKEQIPIANIDAVLSGKLENPFQDVLVSDEGFEEALPSTVGPTICQTNHSKLSRTRSSSSRYSGDGRQEKANKRIGSASSGSLLVSRKPSSCSTTNNISYRILAASGTEKKLLIRDKSLEQFKASSNAFGIKIDDSDEEIAKSKLDHLLDFPFPYGENLNDLHEVPPTIKGRLRNVKSTLSLGMKRRQSMRKTLRRIKTMATLSRTFPPYSLKGKTLEELSRLGGYSYLLLPCHYGPAPLRLPTCIAACAQYLLRYGLRTSGLYREIGDCITVSELYNYYAAQVLSEKQKDSIDWTIRTIELPIDSLSLAQARESSFVHDVGTVFRCLLYGLPGGIIGSPRLFRVLQDIFTHDFLPVNIYCDPGRKDYITDADPLTSARHRLAALAIVAFSEDYQLELICSVIGLLSFTVDECDIRSRVHLPLHGAGRYCTMCEKLPNIDVVSKAFGEMMTGPITFEEPENKGVENGRDERGGAFLMKKLLGSWKDICFYLQIWEVFG